MTTGIDDHEDTPMTTTTPRRRRNKRPKPPPAAFARRYVDGNLMTPDDAAAYLQIARSTLKRWVCEGTIEFVRTGRLVRFTKAGLDRWIAKQTRVPKAAR